MPGLTVGNVEMSKKLFQLIFANKLEEVPDKICCTHSEGKEHLDQELLRGIRCECYQGCIKGGEGYPPPPSWDLANFNM